ncbi:MAG: amino acid ABC transporter substrate-binding protein [Anaerolineales bacterium]|nr:amino acid ABC transporter substrate-binding protein [Anaerolineales bacterium]
MKRSVFSIFTVLVLMGLILSACGPSAPAATDEPGEPAAPGATDEPAPAGTDEPSEPQFAGTIKIGAALSETGTYATIGLDVRQGYLLWVDYVNDELGGINVGGEMYNVELILYDDESDADTATKLIEQLISEDEVDFIFGPYGSSLTVATSTITEQYGVLMIEANGAAETIFDRGYKYVFGVLSPASYYSKAVIEALADAGAETLVIAYEDEAFSIAIRDGALKWADEYGLEVLMVESYPKANTDSALFDPIMTKFKAANPDAYLNAGHLNDGIAARSAAKSLGFCPGAMIFMSSANVPAFVDELGDQAEYAVGATQWQETMSYQGMYIGTPQEYYQRYVDRYGMDPSYQSAESTAAGFALQYAIEQAGTLETEAVRQELLDMDIMTFYGAINFDETGKNVAHAMGAGQILDGKFQVIWPPEAAVEDFVFPDPTCSQ